MLRGGLCLKHRSKIMSYSSVFDFITHRILVAQLALVLYLLIVAAIIKATTSKVFFVVVVVVVPPVNSLT